MELIVKSACEIVSLLKSREMRRCDFLTVVGLRGVKVIAAEPVHEVAGR